MDVFEFWALKKNFKNTLASVLRGGREGSAKFVPHVKSEREMMRRDRAFIMELDKYVRANWDIPAGDIGVGEREIGFLFGAYKKLAGEFSAVLTGKAASYGGSLIRPQATGYGLIYFVLEMLELLGRRLSGQKVLISGSDTVALYAAYKAIQEDAKVMTLSDSDGVLVFRDGMKIEQWQRIADHKQQKRGRLAELDAVFPEAKYHAGKTPWYLHADNALPSAIQNELDDKAAKILIDNGCKLVADGANMPCTMEAIALFDQAGVVFAPGKACNAGVVWVRGLEITQNTLRTSWTGHEVDAHLLTIMHKIRCACVHHGAQEGK